MRIAAFIAFLLLASNALSQTMKSPKEECEDLMNDLTPFAEKMLVEYGEFLPFGGKMLKTGEIVHVGAYDGREQPPSQDLIDLMRKGFTEEAKEGELKATAIVYDVRTIPPGKTEKMDAIQMDLNHRDGYSVSVFFPYRLKGKEIEFHELFASSLDFDPFAN